MIDDARKVTVTASWIRETRESIGQDEVDEVAPRMGWSAHSDDKTQNITFAHTLSILSASLYDSCDYCCLLVVYMYFRLELGPTLLILSLSRLLFCFSCNVDTVDSQDEQHQSDHVL